MFGQKNHVLLNSIKVSFLGALLLFITIASSGCSQGETYEGTVNKVISFVGSNNDVPFHAISLNEHKDKKFIFLAENAEKFGFNNLLKGPLPPNSMSFKGKSITISNLWLSGDKTEQLGKKVKLMARKKAFFKDKDGKEVDNDYEVTAVEWIK